jgi:hypothetical protein
MEGVVLFPSAFAITSDLSPIRQDTQEFVVPKSIQITFAIVDLYKKDKKAV